MVKLLECKWGHSDNGNTFGLHPENADSISAGSTELLNNLFCPRLTNGLGGRPLKAKMWVRIPSWALMLVDL